MKASSLVEQIRSLLTSPQSDQFFTDAEIIEWIHEGANTVFPFLPEEMLRKHLAQVVVSLGGIVPLNDFAMVSIPSDLLRIKSVEVESSTKGEYIAAVAADYNEMIGIRDRLRFYDSTTYRNFYFAVIQNQIAIYPAVGTSVRITYIRFPQKPSGNTECDYPEQIYPLVINWALGRGKMKDNRVQEAQIYFNWFWSVVQAYQTKYLQVPPIVGVTPLEQERRT